MPIKSFKFITAGFAIALAATGSLFATNFDNKLTGADLVAKINAKSPTLTSYAQELVESATLNRGIKETKYGQAFPLNPQALGPLMDECEGKVVLELAAAGGQNGLLLLLAGAKQVILNDICKQEMQGVLSRVMQLPKDQASKVRILAGDCLKLEGKIPAHSCDIIIARNLMHLLPKNQHGNFLNLVHQFLKPDGKFYISANNLNVLRSTLTHEQDLEEIKKTGFSENYTLVFDEIGGLNVLNTCSKSSKTDQGDPTGFIYSYQLQAPYPQTLSTPDPNNIPEHLFNFLKQYISERREILDTFPYNRATQFRVIKNFTFYFNQTLIQEVLSNHGFETISTGHIYPDGEIFQAPDWSADASNGILLAVMAKPIQNPIIEISKTVD